MGKQEEKLNFIPKRVGLFWDMDPDQLDIKQHAHFIIERIMNFGEDSEVRWMWKTYPKDLLAHVAKTSRDLRPETCSLWTLLTQ